MGTKRIFFIIGSTLCTVGLVCGYILMPVIHVWTIVIAYQVSGLFGAVASLIFPVIAQIYWFIRVWSITGTFWNLYCLAIVAFVLFVIIGFVIVSILPKDDPA